MAARFPTPRLLPTTIAFMAVLFAVKCGILVDGLVFQGPKPDGAMVTPARAGEADAQKNAKSASAQSQGISASTEAKPAAPLPHAGGRTDAKSTGAATASAKDPNAPVEPETPLVNESEKALLQDLRHRRQELDAQSDTLNAREAVLGAAEQKITARVGELQALQHRLETLSSEQKQKEDAGWQGLAKMYEAMKPRDAANIFNDLSMPVLLQVLDRMKDAKAASVMAAMNPDKARDVTAELARLRLGHDPAVPPDDPRPLPTGS
jgi:flagellar motility protein MotE (MotC chaperone)